LWLYDKALSSQSVDPRQKAQLPHSRGEALRRVHRWKEALSDWEEALVAYEELGDANGIATVSADMAEHLAWGESRWQEAMRLIHKTLVALGKRPRERGLGRIARRFAAIFWEGSIASFDRATWS
jgi:hypothetical protein